MQEQLSDHLHRAPSRRRGKTALVATLVLVLAIAGVLVAIYKPLNFLRYGSAEPPLPGAGANLEAPLAARIQERVVLVRSKPYDGEVWGMLGETYDVHELFPQAVTCFERAQVLAPNEVRWPYFLGLVQRIGDQKRALACFERAIALAPDMASAHFFAGHGYLQSERFDDAKREFTRALELEHDVPATLIGLAKVALSKNDPTAALEFLERAKQQNPSTKEADWLMAAAWRALGDETKAGQFAAPGEAPPAQESFPDRLRAQEQSQEGVTLSFARTRAGLLIERGAPEAAVKEITRYLDLAPTSAPALIALGDVYMKIGKPEEAIPRFQAALTIDPTKSEALMGWGAALVRSGKREEALAKLRQALALDSSNLEVKLNLAAALAESSSKAEREESLALMIEVSQARPLDLSSWVNLAQAQGANGHADEAIAAFQRALKLSPDDVGLRHQFGVLCARVGNIDKAAEAFAAVVQAEPAVIEARLNLIHALTELKRHPEAIAALRSAHELAPKNIQWRAQLAWLLATSPEDAARSGEEALSLARELSEATEGKNPEFLVILAAAQAESGDIPAATKSVDAALEMMKPKGADPQAEEKFTEIIGRALGCRDAFKEGKPYRIDVP